jgi:DNA-directed RNA polymerase subunit RPC12/RpoP
VSWILPEFVNRDLPLSKPERKAIHREAWRLWMANKWNVALYLILPASYLIGMNFVSDLGGRLGGLVGATGLAHKLFRAGAPAVFLVLCFVLGGAVLQRYRFAPCVYRATRKHGYDVCVKCGYWLRGLGDDIERCPECGTRRETMPRKPM